VCHGQQRLGVRCNSEPNRVCLVSFFQILGATFSTNAKLFKISRRGAAKQAKKAVKYTACDSLRMRGVLSSTMFGKMKVLTKQKIWTDTSCYSRLFR
jgi:hypothetical protein